MPCLRGIEVYLNHGMDPGQQRDPLNLRNIDNRLPEFPHPDAPSIRLSPRPDASQHPGTWINESNIVKRNSRVSVYVPSEQGRRFAIEWHIKRPEEHSCYVYFTILFNGRRIVSWGADTNQANRGITEYALYGQNNKRNSIDTMAATRLHEMEKRYFYFFSGTGTRPANDGGLIEVQAFRARGRRLRAPAPPKYRGQENYGITCPSGGSAESERDLSYYDWHLHDRIDDPFITFRFHYRSLENLQYLSIVPPNHRMPEMMLPSQLSFESKASCGGEYLCSGPVEYTDLINQDVVEKPSRVGERRRQDIDTLKQGLQPPPELFPVLSRGTHQLPQPRKAARCANGGEHLERPLPVIPCSPSQSSSTGSLGESSSVRSRASTGAASVTSSLCEYINDLSTDLEEAEVCDARAIPLQRASREPDGPARRAGKDFFVRNDPANWNEMSHKRTSRRDSSKTFLSSGSRSDYGGSLAPPNTAHIPSRRGYVTARCFYPERTLQESSPILEGRSLEPSNPVKDIVPVFIPEGQWIRPTSRRAPSPLRHRQTQTGLNLLASGHEGSP